MIIKQLLLNNFRNYESGCWQFSNGINILYGDNGQGKTNILESIYFCAFGFSHRTSQEADLINIAFNNMSVITNFFSIDIEKKIIIKKEGRRQRKEIILDYDKIKPRELIGQLKVIMFSPEDLQLIKNDPSTRRRFLDMEISQINSKYCFSLAKYNKILQHRNKLLLEIKEKNINENNLDVWDEQLSKEAAYLIEQRLNNLDVLSNLFSEIYSNIAENSEKVSLIYKRKENDSDNLIKFEENLDYFHWYKSNLKNRRSKDIERAATGIGLHRDDILFTINEKPIKAYGSQGQQRTFILALKIAEIQLIKKQCGEYPILLLDDVMSELDMKRRKNLLDFLTGKVQTFITVTDKESIASFTNAKYFQVKQANIIEEMS